MVVKYIVNQLAKLEKVHLHKWKHTEAKYYGAVYLGQTPDVSATRTCKVCGKAQYLDVHCLGLNPEKYTKTWLDNSKAMDPTIPSDDFLAGMRVAQDIAWVVYKHHGKDEATAYQTHEAIRITTNDLMDEYGTGPTKLMLGLKDHQISKVGVIVKDIT